MSTSSATAIIARGKDLAGMTWPEFDYDLIAGQTAAAHVEMAIGEAVQLELGTITPGVGEEVLVQHEQARRVLRVQVAPFLAERMAAARARGFTGWSHASRGPIRYAR